MLASQTHTLHTDAADDLVNASANALFRVAFGFERFVSSVIADNLHAADAGVVILDALEPGDVRETASRMKVIPTDARMSDFAPIMSKLHTLAVLAGRVSKLESADDDMPRIVSAMQVEMSKLARVDFDLWDAFASSGKSHLTGPDAAILETSGFAWTASRKGHTTTVRYDASAERYIRSHKASHAYLPASGSLSERDIAAL